MTADAKASSYKVCDYSDTDYAMFWSEHNREYEDTVERIALRRLTNDMSGTCLEIGCGFGRLVNEYATRCSQVLLTDYAGNMIRQAQIRVQCLKLKHVACAKTNLYELDKLGCRLDNAICIRVMHHIENVPAFFEQVNMVLRDGGLFVLEYANKKNLLEILRWLFRKPNIDPFAYEPGRRKGDIYYNFHPDYVKDMLMKAGFMIETELSVSIFRSAVLKKIFGCRVLSRIEQRLQKPFAWFHPGPSVFLKARKVRDISQEATQYGQPEQMKI